MSSPTGNALLRTPCAAETEGGPLHPDTARARGQTLRLTGQVLALTGDLLPTPRASDKNGPGVHGKGGQDLRTTVSPLPASTATDCDEGKGVFDWGKYEPAIQRWEQVLGRKCPNPTSPTGKNGSAQLASRFVEWMMGLPDGWVTDVEITRAQQIKALGNGVVPQQGAVALRVMKRWGNEKEN